MSFSDFSIEMKESNSSYTSLDGNEETVAVQREKKGKIPCDKIVIITGRSFLALFILFYYAFSIKGLIETNYIEERKICKMSDLWSYLFSSLFANFIFIKLTTKINENRLFIILQPNIYIGCIKFSYILWGSILFYGVPCLNELSDTLLFKMALLQYMFDIVSLALTFIISLYVVNLVYEDNKKTKEQAIEAIANAMNYDNKEPNNSEPETISVNI